MRAPFPAVWLSARGIWVFLALGVLIAFASVLPALLIVSLVAAACVLAALAVDFAYGPTRRTLTIVREPVDYVALRRSAEVGYRIENRSALPIRIGIFETPLATIDFERASLEAAVAARARTTVLQTMLPRERGKAQFGTIYAWAENRLGLLRRRFAFEGAQEVRVFPDLSAVEGYGLLARRSTLIDAGLRKLRLRGVGTDFESLREYADGDAFRAIDWKATARRGRVMVVQHEVERSQNVIVALDAGRLMWPRIGAQRKFDYAVTAALSIAKVAQAAGDNVGLVAFGAQPLLSVAPRRGAAHVNALAQAVYDLQPRLEEPDYERTFGELRRRYSKRSLIVLFTDMFDPVTSANVLAGLGILTPPHLVMCVLMNDAAISAALDEEPHDEARAYRASVALGLLEERSRAIAMLRARGILVVDVPAARLTLSLLDAYLDVKGRGLL
jgi:uncharacterized protein (DUF58 family)